jgi:hypothetical protein
MSAVFASVAAIGVRCSVFGLRLGATAAALGAVLFFILGSLASGQRDAGGPSMKK